MSQPTQPVTLGQLLKQLIPTTPGTSMPDDEDDALVQAASIPKLGDLIRQAVASGDITPQPHYAAA